MNSVRSDEKHLLYGVALVTLYTFFIALMSLFAKISTAYISISEIVFLQCLIGFIAVLPIIVQQKIILKTKKLPWHVVRALTGTGAWYLMYQAIALTSLTIGTLLTFSSPLLVPFVARFVFKTKVNLPVWLAVSVGFIGIILVLNPFHHQTQPIAYMGIFFGVISAVLMTITQFVLGTLRKTETTLTVLFYYLLFSSLIFGPSALLHWINPPFFIWTLMLITGLLMAGSQFVFTSAYRFASPVHLGAFIYLTIVFSAVLDAFILHSHVCALKWIGIALVMLGGALIIFLEQTELKIEEI